MQRADVLRKLRAESDNLRDRYGVESLALFGSVARDEARPDSDVDVLVEFGRPITLFDLVAVQQYLERCLGVRRVDLVPRNSINPAFREAILGEALEVRSRGLAGLFGKFRDDPTLREICEAAYKERDNDLPSQVSGYFDDGGHIMRGWVIGIAVLLLLGAAGWYGLHFVPADFIYAVETEFDQVPADDAALEKWVQLQPRVFRAWVERKPAGTRSRVVVTLGMTQNGWREPPFPDLTTKCAELGYRGQQGPFRDQPR